MSEKSFMIMVETFDLETDETTQTREIDYSQVENRKWLGKHSFWAFNNGFGVTTYKVEAEQ